MRPNVNLPRQEAPAGTAAGLAYAVVCYFFSQGTFLYFILFLNGLWVPKGVDDGNPKPVLVALALNFGLVLLWTAQHSVMARRSFKERWTRFVPPHVERATYGLASGIALLVLMLAWTPVGGVLWSIESTVARGAIFAVQIGAWLLLLAASFEIDHYETFGLKQPLYAMQGRTPDPIEFQVKRIYRFVRHPIQTGIFVGLYFEERDLVRRFGARYDRYKKDVPRLLPWRMPRP